MESPYFRKTKQKYFDVNIYINNILHKKFHIANSKGWKYVNIKDLESNNDSLKVDFEIISNVDYNVASWQKASLVNFKFLTIREQRATHE